MVKTRTAVGVGAIALGLGIMFASPASATKGHHHKEWVCHPVEGKGELGNGWNLINPDKASSHMNDNGTPNDLSDDYGKHTRKDGRTDVYAVGKTCPGGATSTSPTTVPTATTTTTSTGTTTTSSTTSATSSTSSTSSTTTNPPPVTESPTTQPPATKPPVTNPPKEVVKPKPITKPKPVVKNPVPTTQPPTELAFTGVNPVSLFVAIVLILAGIVSILTARKIEVVRNV